MIMCADGIVLLAKKSGPTSFSALHSVKKALGTSKVGHTGTLDSFAQGLLVVCTGRLTRLAGNITEFDKTYEAVIKFGEETDTLECTGKIVRTAPLPPKDDFERAVKSFSGELMQRPPSFSAIHVGGKRASDLARTGAPQELPERRITVYSSKVKDIRMSADGRVEYALIEFSVSKGTYIRSLARDIASECGSAAHLVGLYRTKVGNFLVEDSAGFRSLDDFSIDSAIRQADDFSGAEKPENQDEKKLDVRDDEAEKNLQNEIREKRMDFDADTARQCGFDVITTAGASATTDFQNGRPLRSPNFSRSLHSIANDTSAAVFSPDGRFLGLIFKDADGKVAYKFVIN